MDQPATAPDELDPTGRFSGLAAIYDRNRPSYPAAALDYLVHHCRLEQNSCVVDVGCGTGISARQFAQRGLTVIGIEPNDDMRRQAEQQTTALDAPSLSYRTGRAEATGLPTGSADLILAAQAFHWFEPTATLREFRRLLKPMGWVALLWNERDESDLGTAAYGQVLRTTAEAEQIEASRSRSGSALLTSPDFQHAERIWFGHEQPVDEVGLLGRALSVSYAPKQAEEIEKFKTSLREVFARFQNAGNFVLRYHTLVVLAQRGPGS